jgi:RNA recognition motif-containing protein
MGGERPVFCGNFEYDASAREIERLFERYGPLDRVDMKTGEAQPPSHRPRQSARQHPGNIKMPCEPTLHLPAIQHAQCPELRRLTSNLSTGSELTTTCSHTYPPTSTHNPWLYLFINVDNFRLTSP